MKLLADEGVDRLIVVRLREDGHEVDYVAEMEPGADDDQVLSHANQHQALLITADKDFGELVLSRQSCRKANTRRVRATAFERH